MVSATPAVAPKLDLIRNLLSVFPEIPGTHRPPEKEKNEGELSIMFAHSFTAAKVLEKLIIIELRVNIDLLSPKILSR